MERLIKDGKLNFDGADKIAFSRLGIGFEKLDRDVFDPRKAYDKVSRIGVKRIRLQSGWQKTEKEEGIYCFEWLDEIVDNLISRGMQPWLCFCYGNPIYTELAKPVFGAVGCPPISTEREKNAWLRYVEATVAHFRGRIDLYEIWNEADSNYSWRHEEGEVPDPARHIRNAHEYGEFAMETAQAIKRADSEAKVAGFALAHSNDLNYVDHAMSTGLYKYIDYVTFHIYSVNDNDRSKIINNLRNLVHSYNPNIRLIQGESGSQSRSDGHGAMYGFAWTPEKQTKLLLRTLICDIHEGVDFTSYFSTMDMIEALRGRLSDKSSYLDYGYFGVLSAEFDENGIATGEYSEKPSYYALSALASFLRGDSHKESIPYTREYLPSRRVNGTDCKDDTLQTYSFRLDDGSTAFCYWNGTPILTDTYEGTVSFKIFAQRNDNIRLVDLKDGSIYRFNEDMCQDLGERGVLLKNIPLTDSPLAIWFR